MGMSYSGIGPPLKISITSELVTPTSHSDSTFVISQVLEGYEEIHSCYTVSILVVLIHFCYLSCMTLCSASLSISRH